MDSLKLDKRRIFNLSNIFLMILLSAIGIIITLKMLGLNIYEPLLASKELNDFANMLESYWYLSIIIYAVFGYIFVYFLVFSLAQRWGTKSLWHNFIIVIVALLFYTLRLFVQPITAMTFIYDVIQYIIIPILYCKFVLKTENKQLLSNSIDGYLQLCGLLFLAQVLNNSALIISTYGNFIEHFITYIEVYIGISALYIRSNLRRGGIDYGKYDKSNQ